MATGGIVLREGPKNLNDYVPPSKAASSVVNNRMALIRAEEKDGQIHLDIEWNFSNIIDACKRRKEDALTFGTGFKITGRSLFEIKSDLISSISGFDPVILKSDNEIRQYIGKNIELSSDLDGKLELLFRPMSDWVHDRYNVNFRNGRIWDMDESKLSKEMFAREDNLLSHSVVLHQFISAVSKVFYNKTIFLDIVRLRPFLLSAILPIVMQRSVGSIWIVFDSGDNFSGFRLPSISRDYATASDLNRAVSKIIGLSINAAKSLISEKPIYHYSLQNHLNLYTLEEFSQALRYYYDQAEATDLSSAPNIPTPRSAPLEFIVVDGLLDLSDEVGVDKSQETMILAAASEIIDLIDDISNHHNISNVAPILNAKTKRMRDKLSVITSGNFSEGVIIGLGMLTEATHEGYLCERDDLMPGAEGALKGLITQSRIFLNRFNAWRSYLSNSQAGDIAESVSDVAVKFLTSATQSEELVYPESREKIQDLIEEMNVWPLPAERAGVLASVQNMLAVSATAVKDAILMGASKIVGLSGKIARDAMVKLIVDNGLSVLTVFLLANQPLVNELAHAVPALFGWAPDFLVWLMKMKSGG